MRHNFWLAKPYGLANQKLCRIQMFCCLQIHRAPPGWLSDERVITLWLWVRYPVEGNFLSGVYSPLTSADYCEKSSKWI